MKKDNEERDIVVAFLRNGYPGLAFATVIIKSSRRLAFSAVVLACIAYPPYPAAIFELARTGAAAVKLPAWGLR